MRVRLWFDSMARPDVSTHNPTPTHYSLLVTATAHCTLPTPHAQIYSDGTWKAVVQVRQRVDHKRTFYYLEQLLLKHDMHSKALSIESFKDGKRGV